MPIFVSGSGGGGGGYKYPPRAVTGVETYKGTDGKWYIRWTDPEDLIVDNKVISEWKGTIVIKNSIRQPVSIDDGYIVVDSKVRNAYKTDGYRLGDDAQGYFYGVFPYTKYYVTNNTGAEFDYIFNEDAIGNLSNASWGDIEYACKIGKASEYWNAEDTIRIILSGEYVGNVDMQIAGFNYDVTDSQNEEVISFISKVCIPGIMYVDIDNVLLSIYDSLPANVRSIIKNVVKSTSYYDYEVGSNGSVMSEEFRGKIFVPSITEVYTPLEIPDFAYETHSAAGKKIFSFNTNQMPYEIFNEEGSKNRVKKYQGGGEGPWWLRNYAALIYHDTNPDDVTKIRNLVIRGNGALGTPIMENNYTTGRAFAIRSESYGICFGFCI